MTRPTPRENLPREIEEKSTGLPVYDSTLQGTKDNATDMSLRGIPEEYWMFGRYVLV